MTDLSKSLVLYAVLILAGFVWYQTSQPVPPDPTLSTPQAAIHG